MTQVSFPGDRYVTDWQAIGGLLCTSHGAPA
jgi:hypothetical protein